MPKERVQKILSAWGIASRRKVEEMIRQGRVTVNGQKAFLGESADPQHDRIALDGTALSVPSDRIYLALHKPRGYVTTMEDEKNRSCVADLIQDIGVRVYPVGRLDKDSEGLLLMTNDGAFANAVAHPGGNVTKTYRVTLRPSISEEQLAQMEAGVEIDGKVTAPFQVRVLAQEPGRVVVEMILSEGRNREIRKICAALGLEVARLKRTAVGPVRLGMLAPGKYRALTNQELAGLKALSKPERGKHNDLHLAHAKQRRGKETAVHRPQNGGERPHSSNEGRRGSHGLGGR